jgi:DsbC/DsbD-like thiol-disulfide interchange protein
MGPTPFSRAAALAAGLGACLALSAPGTPAFAQAKKSDSVVKVTATATRPDADGKQTVTLTLDIEKPWHVYANPVGNDSLDDAATTVTLDAKEKPEVLKVDYPAGKVEKDEVVGDYKIYEDRVVIKAAVRRARGDTGPLTVSVKLQACSTMGKSGMCLVPATVKVSVP